MKLRTRLFFYGGVIPTIGMLLATLVGGWLFRRNAMAGLDRALLAQAAVESVSLFDRPGGAPHLHLASSPLGDRVRSFAPVAVLYDAHGEPTVTYPNGYVAPPIDALALELNEPVVVDAVDGTGQPVRRLWLRVSGPGATEYRLSLSGALDAADSATSAYYRTSFLMLVAMVLVMWLSQSALAANLSRRIGAMIAHLPQLERGRFESTLPSDRTGDELSQLREALNDATRQLARARQSEERFLANAAHELRTPLSLLRTRLDLSLRRPRTDAELKEALVEARGDVDRLAQLATKLLESAHPAAPTKMAVDLADVVRTLAGQWLPLFRERGMDLVTRGPAALVAHVDRLEIERAIGNLIDNARKFGAESSAVEVRVEERAGSARISVTNVGSPIAEAERERIFEPFVRGDLRQPGSGLGLALVREVARRHEGRAYVEASAADRTTFVLELPLGR